MINLNSVSCTFYEKQYTLTPINHLNLCIPTGEFICITGRSGSGKTTLLKMIGGLLSPSEGTIIVDGVDITNLNPNQLSDYRRTNIGFIFQDYLLEDTYTVYQNLEIVLMISGISVNKRASMIEQVLDVCKLSGRENSITANLSGGEKQRVGIARAILTNSNYLLADEPCGNLDYENSQIILGLLKEQCKTGKTVILVTHNLEDAKYTDRIIELKDGNIIKDGLTRHT